MLIPSQAWAEGKHQRDATGHEGFSAAGLLAGVAGLIWGKCTMPKNVWFGLFLIIFAVPSHANVIYESLGQPAVAGASSLRDYHILIMGFLPSCHISLFLLRKSLKLCFRVTFPSNLKGKTSAMLGFWCVLVSCCQTCLKG